MVTRWDSYWPFGLLHVTNLFSESRVTFFMSMYNAISLTTNLIQWYVNCFINNIFTGTVCPTQAPATCPTWTTKLPVTSLSTSTPTPSSTAPPVSVDFRLPNDVIPLEYEVTIKPNMLNGNPDSFDFEGSVKIKIECKTSTNNIILHGNMLNISNVKFGAITDSKRMIPAPQFDPQRQFLTFRLNEFLQTSRTYELSMDFRGPLKNDLKGLYLSSYSHGGQTR